MAQWYDEIEDLSTSDPGLKLGRSGDVNPIANIVHIQGGWVTVPTTASMYDLPKERLFDGQIIYVSESYQTFRTERFQPGITPGYMEL